MTARRRFTPVRDLLGMARTSSYLTPRKQRGDGLEDIVFSVVESPGSVTRHEPGLIKWRTWLKKLRFRSRTLDLVLRSQTDHLLCLSEDIKRLRDHIFRLLHASSHVLERASLNVFRKRYSNFPSCLSQGRGHERKVFDHFVNDGAEGANEIRRLITLEHEKLTSEILEALSFQRGLERLYNERPSSNISGARIPNLADLKSPLYGHISSDTLLRHSRAIDQRIDPSLDLEGDFSGTEVDHSLRHLNLTLFQQPSSPSDVEPPPYSAFDRGPEVFRLGINVEVSRLDLHKVPRALNSWDDSDISSPVSPSDFFSFTISNLSCMTGELSMPLSSLCARLEDSRISDGSSVSKLIRRREIKGLQHEFLLVEAMLSDGQAIWLRLERAAVRRPSREFTFRSVSMVFPPDDTARIACAPQSLFRAEESEIKTEITFTTSRVSLHTLGVLLSSFVQESKAYSLMFENCWFFCSVVLQLLCEAFPDHHAKGELRRDGRGRGVYAAIRKQFSERMHQ